MLVKKKLLNSSYLFFIKSLFTKFLLGLGFIFLIIIISSSTYYFSSGIGDTHTFKSVITKVNDKVLNPYLGIDLQKFDKYFDLGKIKIKYLFIKPEIQQLELKVSQKTILQIENQRKIKKENSGMLPPEFFNMYPLKIQNNNEEYKAKIRIKGVRPIHWKNKESSSYKIDLIGEKRLWGMEEFSIQKPITKNYAYEFLFHKLLKKSNNLYLKYFPINLYFNDENRGVFAIEESFSKELLERQKKRNGPIFSLNEDIGEWYPNVNYELYSESYWISQYPKLTESAFSILNKVKDNENLDIENYFDIDRWASYFAVIDLLGSYHGSLPKSVRLYFNPTTSKFEPIGYDAHFGAGDFSNFILADLLQEKRSNCIYICEEYDWYFKFFKLKNGQLNFSFLEKYIYYLELYSSDKFINEFLVEINDELNNFNLSVYSETSKVDKISRKGLGPYLYDDQIIFKRANLIKQRINSIKINNLKISLKNKELIFKDNYSNFPVKITSTDCDNGVDEEFYLAGNMTIEWHKGCKKIVIEEYEETPIFVKEDITMSKKKIINIEKDFINLASHPAVEKKSKNNFIISENLILKKNTYIKKNQNFIINNNVVLKLINNSVLFVKGNINFNGIKEKEIFVKSDGTGSIIFANNNVKIKNTNFENLGYPKLEQYSLFGGLNFIKSNVILENVTIQKSNSEDAINFINSQSVLKNIFLQNIRSDAIDIDFGSSEFEKINCLEVRNDCFDISGAEINGTKLIASNAYDKALSAGENSNIYITDLNLMNNKVGIAVKDGSKVTLKNLNLFNNEYDVAIYNKKNEFSVPDLKIYNFNANNKKILQSKKSNLSINDIKIIGEYTNAYINSQIY